MIRIHHGKPLRQLRPFIDHEGRKVNVWICDVCRNKFAKRTAPKWTEEQLIERRAARLAR